MKITNILILAAAPITALALPANVTHAAQADAPVPANRLDRTTGIVVGCVAAAAVVTYGSINLYRSNVGGV